MHEFDLRNNFQCLFRLFFIIFRWSRRCCRALKRPAAPPLGSAPQVTRVAGGGCVHMVPAARYGAYDFDNGGEDDGDDKIMHKTGTWRTTTCSLLVLVEPSSSLAWLSRERHYCSSHQQTCGWASTTHLYEVVDEWHTGKDDDGPLHNRRRGRCVGRIFKLDKMKLKQSWGRGSAMSTVGSPQV